MEKFNKHPYFPLRTLAACTAAALTVLLPIHAAATTFDQQPLVGVGSVYPPNILLALSVEYPTAGAAYEAANIWNPKGKRQLNEQKFDQSKSFIGYFDSGKCYSYIGSGDNAYFTPVNTTNNGNCGGNTFSGKVLNWLGMSAIDIFRKEMTGGNRAFGAKGSSVENYQNGDMPNRTTLRRAFVMGGEYSTNVESFLNRSISATLLNRTMPSVARTIRSSSGLQDDITVMSSGFKITFCNAPTKIPNSATRIQRSYMNCNEGDANSQTFNMVVEVCKPGLLEDNCRQYGPYYKPEGIMQAKAEKARFSVFGYMNVGTHDGGVMRARMKSLLGGRTNTGIDLGKEINETDGTFIINPDAKDADASGVSNSGVINYLNKFGDAGTYKTLDPVDELYYTGLLYLRNRKDLVPASFSAIPPDPVKAATAKDGFPVISSSNWDDPLLPQTKDNLGNWVESATDGKAAVCRPNYILFIGDTNSNLDQDLPGSGPEYANSHVSDSEIDVSLYMNKIKTNESKVDPKIHSGYQLTNRSSSKSYGAIAGLAYWARTNDFRPQLLGKQYIKSIMLDVVEHNDYKGWANQFYWAAKYGGFYSSKEEEEGGTPELTAYESDRWRWTDDAVGKSRIIKSNGQTPFPDGVPRNYSAANNPESMIEALRSSFNAASARSDNPSQAVLNAELNKNGVLDLTTKEKPFVLQSSYKKSQQFGWQGDVIAYYLSDDGNTRFSTPQWQLSTLFSTKYRSGWNSRNIWTRSGRNTVLLQNVASSVFNLKSGESTSANYNAQNLIQYIRGSDEFEQDGTFRKRAVDGLLGTVVNSAVTPILAPAEETVADTCKYENFASVRNRTTVYAFAANDGMLHIVGKDGEEKYAYIPSTALPKLKNYALSRQPDNTSDGHIFLNDGTPVTAEICLGNGTNKKAKSVIIGTAGRGGEAVYAVDATNLDNAGSANLLWEFSKADDDGLGLTIHKPVITEIESNGGKKAVAIVSSGYKVDKNYKGYIYILDIGKSGGPWINGTHYQRIELGNSGVGAPKVLDTDSDGASDRIYVGDESGNLWRIDYDKATKKWTAKNIFTSTAQEPITGAPDSIASRNGYTVIFSTGKYFTVEDSTRRNLQNYAYGLFDTDGSKIAETSLLGQTINSVAPVASQTDRTYYSASQNALSDKHKGWKLSLPSGFISIDDALIRNKRVAQFFAFNVNHNDSINTNRNTNNGNICSNNSGVSALIEVDLQTGGMYRNPVFDTNRDHRFDNSDALSAMVVHTGQLALKRNTVTMLTKAGKKQGSLLVGDSGEPTNENLNPLFNTVHRISWGEIF